MATPALSEVIGMATPPARVARHSLIATALFSLHPSVFAYFLLPFFHFLLSSPSLNAGIRNQYPRHPPSTATSRKSM
jgi:hypothetical protein